MELFVGEMGSHSFETCRNQYNVSRMATQDESVVIKLVSYDNKEFEVPQKVAFMSELVKQMCTVSSEFSKEIVIPDVTGDILKKVIDFCLDLFSL